MIGTKFYYTGNMANPSDICEVVKEDGNDLIVIYSKNPEKEKRVPKCLINPVSEKTFNSGNQWLELKAYKAFQKEKYAKNGIQF